tara:strand:+ start:44976 stop:45599 length:624 start_codon:yes stop_codon:yes gene_type:complete
MKNKKLIDMSPIEIESHFSELRNFISNKNYMLHNLLYYYKKYIHYDNKEDFYNFYLEPYKNRIRINDEDINNIINNNINFSSFCKLISRSSSLFEKKKYDPLFLFNFLLIGFQIKNNDINLVLITSIIDKSITDKILKHDSFKNFNVSLSNVDTDCDFYITIMENENYLFMEKDIRDCIFYINDNFKDDDINSIEKYINQKFPIFIT